MDITAANSPGSTIFQNEREMFQDLSTRLLNGIFNRIFALTIRGSRQRRAVISLLVLAAVPLLYLVTQGFSQWFNFLETLVSTLMAGEPSSQETLRIFLTLALDPRIIRLLPILLLPFLFSREFASRYLADIFELDETGDELKIARKFISEVSLGGADNHLRVGVDSFDSDETKESPIRRIGGPGRVTVELGTAILVERPDGFPRIIGPAASEEPVDDQPPAGKLEKQLYREGDRWHVKFRPRPIIPPAKKKPAPKKDKNILEGFERIREPIDLRVQMPEALEVNARSQDGIPIKVIDARVVFSISRGIRVPTLKEPYPYTEEAVFALVYKKPNRVISTQKFPSVWEEQTTTMKALLREEMGDFMGGHELGEYLASIGQLETEAINQIQIDISTEKQKLSGLETHPSKDHPTKPTRKPRSEVSRLFNDFNGKFNLEQKKRGVEAQWVGVGTWKMPPGIPEKVIPQKHLTAWQVTLENLRRGNEQELNELELNAQAEGIQHLILEAPIGAYHEIKNPTLNLNRARLSLITAYWQQLKKGMENLIRLEKPVPPSMVAAYFKLLLTISHPAYPNIPAPSSARERKLYEELLKKVKYPQAIEKLIELERRFAPNASREELLKRILDNWEKDVK